MSDQRPTHEVLRIAGALTVIVLVAYAASLFGGATFVGRDHLPHTLPSKQVLADALRHGHLPEWWSGVDLGVPFAANPNHSALYPVAWLVAIVPMPWGADALLVLHVLIAGLGAAALSRRFGASALGATLAGAGFMLSGFTTSIVVHGGPLLTLAWMPWIAWAGDRLALSRRSVSAAMLLSALLGLQLLAGDPSIVVLSGFVLLSVILCRSQQRGRALLAAAASVTSAVALAAVLIIPALLLARESTRSAGVEPEMATAWSMHPLRVIEWIWPHVFGDGNQPTEHLARVIANSAGHTELTPAWALSLYISLPVLVLAVIGWVRSPRQLRLIAIPAGVFFLLALGRYTPIYGLYRTVFLPERILRYPEKYVGGTILIVCVVAGVGWTSTTARGLSRRALVAVGATVGVFGLAIAALKLGAGELSRALTRDGAELEPPLDGAAGVDHAMSSGVSALIMIALVIGALYLARRQQLRRWMLPIAVVVIVAHLIAQDWQVLPMFDRAIVERAPAILRDAPPGNHRIFRSDRTFVNTTETVTERALAFYDAAAPNTGTPFGFDYVRGYDQGKSAFFDQTWRVYCNPPSDRILDLFGVGLAIVPTQQFQYRLVANEGRRPRAFVVSRWRWYAEPHAMLEALFHSPGADRDVLATAHLLGSGTNGDGTADLTPCSIVSPQPEIVRVTCESAGGYAMLLDGWAPGWTATVDGIPAAIVRADALVRAVQVGAGHHDIEFRYRTPGLRTGAIVSAIAWLALIGLAIARRRRATSESGPSSP